MFKPQIEKTKKQMDKIKKHFDELLSKNALLRFIKGVVNRIKEDRLADISARITYYLLLAIFPLIIFLLNLLMFFNIDQELLLSTIGKLIPSKSSQLVFDIVNEAITNSDVGLLSLSMLTVIWTASRGINALISGLNKAYDVKEERSFIVVKAVGVLATFGIPLIMLLTFLFLVLGQQIGLYFSNNFGLVDYIGVWEVVRVIMPLVSMFLYFTFLYKFAPNRPILFRQSMIGALFSTVGWVGISILFSSYVNNFGNYSKLYGGLGSVIVLILWLNMSSSILIIGGEINAEMAKPYEHRDQ